MKIFSHIILLTLGWTSLFAQENLTNENSVFNTSSVSDTEQVVVLQQKIANRETIQILSNLGNTLKSGSLENESIDFDMLGQRIHAEIKYTSPNKSGGTNTVGTIPGGHIRIFQVNDALYVHVNIRENIFTTHNYELRKVDGKLVWQEYEIIGGYFHDHDYVQDLHSENTPAPRYGKIDKSLLKSGETGVPFPPHAECTCERFTFHFQITQTLVDDLGSVDEVLALLEGSMAYAQQTLRNTDPRFRYTTIAYTYDIIDISDANGISFNNQTGDTYRYFSWLLVFDDSGPNDVKINAKNAFTSHQVLICKNLLSRLGAAHKLARQDPVSGIYYHVNGIQKAGIGWGRRTVMHEGGHSYGSLGHDGPGYAYTDTVTYTKSTTRTTYDFRIKTIMSNMPSDLPLLTFSNPDTIIIDTVYVDDWYWYSEPFALGNETQNSSDSLAYYFAGPTDEMRDDLLHVKEVGISTVDGESQNSQDSTRLFVVDPDPAVTYRWEDLDTGDTIGFGAEVIIKKPESTKSLIVYPTNHSCLCPGDPDTVVVTNTGIVEDRLKQNIIVYPNPSSGSINITLNGEMQGKDLDLVLYNAIGQVIHRQSYPDAFGNIVVTKSLTPGRYILKVEIERNLVKQFTIICK